MSLAPKTIPVLESPPRVGEITCLAPNLRVILAPNPTPMTYWGTNTYILGSEDVVVIDPGPQNTAHLEAIIEALGAAARVQAILVTHSHLDHSPLARDLQSRCDAPILAFGNSTAGRSARMAGLAKQGQTAGGEGVDTEFSPDRCLMDDETVSFSGNVLKAIHTPGHFCNHLCFRWGDLLFSGDHIMGWASTLISPPDGDLQQYRDSLLKLSKTGLTTLLPGHGPAVLNPDDEIEALVTHRNDRESQILATLSAHPMGLAEITAAIYTDTPKSLFAAAQRNVLAHLIDLLDKNEIEAFGTVGINGQYSRNS